MTRFILPGIMAALSLGQTIYSACDGDWRRAGYWGCAAGITFFVTV